MTSRTAMRLFAAAVALMLLSARADAQTTLRWKFKEGDIHHYQLKQTTKNTATVQGQEIGTTITQDLEMTWKVESVESDGTAKVAQTIDRIQIRLDSPFAQVAYDSAAEEEPQGPAAAVAQVVNAMVGMPVTLTMTNRGEVLDADVPEELVRRLQEAGQAAQGLNNLATADGLKNMMRQSTMELPADEVSEGASWAKEIELPLPTGTTAITNRYTYEGPTTEGGKTLDRIGLAMTIHDIKPDPNAPFDLKIDEQDGKGTFVFDNEVGLLEGSEVEQRMTLIVSAMDQEITSNVVSTARFQRVDDQENQ